MKEKHAYYIKSDMDETLIVVVDGQDIAKAVAVAKRKFEEGKSLTREITEVEHLGLAVIGA